MLPRSGAMKTDVHAWLSESLFAQTDEALWLQAAQAASYPGIVAFHLMPDTHLGYGIPVGGDVSGGEHQGDGLAGRGIGIAAEAAPATSWKPPNGAGSRCQALRYLPDSVLASSPDGVSLPDPMRPSARALK